MFVHTIIGILEIILSVASVIVLIQAVLSTLISFNVVNRHNEFVRSVDNGLTAVCEPLYRPIRRVVPIMGGMDWTPFVALILIRIILYVLGNIDAAVLSNTYVLPQ